MGALLQDLRYGLRALRKNPGLTLVAVLSLGLGIGANTTVFTWLQTFVLKPLPAVQGYDRLVILNTRAPGGDLWSVSYADFRDWRAQSKTLEITIFDFRQTGMRTEDGGTERVWTNFVAENFFDVFRVPMALGRGFQRGAEDEDAQLAVLGWSFWQRRFHGDSAIIGRTLLFNGRPFTVIGVSAPRFGGAYVGLQMDIYVPLTTRSLVFGWDSRWRTSRGWQSFEGVGRLREGVTFAQAAAEIDQIAKAAGIAAGNADHQGAVVRGMDEVGATSWLKPVMFSLLGVTAVVLLIACANVANLMLARAAARRREVAIRLAIGAGRGRLIRQLLTESLVLALLAGAVGFVIALWGRDLMTAFVPAAPFPIGLEYRVDTTILAFAVAVTFATALAFGLVPALQASKPALVPALKDDVGGAFGGRHRLQSALVVGQVALSLVSLVCAGLFVRSLLNARVVDVGFREPERVLLVSTDMTLAGFREDSLQGVMLGQLLARVRALPGVEAAGAAVAVPLGFGGQSSSSAEVEGYQPQPNENMSIRLNLATAGYFEAMGIPLFAGRTFREGDERRGARMAIVNEAFAKKYWPGLDPLGRRIDQGGGWMTVVGVVATGKYNQLTEPPVPMIFQPMGRDRPESDFTLHVRSAAGDPAALTSALRGAFRETSADLPFLDVRTMEQSMQAAIMVQRIGATMLAGFGAMALLLSAVGIYGIMAYTVSQRTREIGVRVALGAASRDVLRLVIGRAMRLSGLGLAIGLAAALGAGRLIQSQLLGVSGSDPVVFGALGLLLGVVALLASWLPARRASRVDPMIALRYE
jgi:predicted permease